MGELSGYRRSDGRWGVRNHVVVLPVRVAAAAAARAAVRGLPGAVVCEHDWNGASDDPDRDTVIRTLAGVAANPNVVRAIVVGVGGRDEEVPDLAVRLGGDVEYLTLAELRGTARAAEAVRPRVEEALRLARGQQREPMPLDALSVGLECGGSDALSGLTANPALGVASDRLVAAGATTILSEVPELVGAEQSLARRAVSPEVGRRIVELIAAFETDVRTLGVDVRGAQPTPGNIEGGLTTIEEKSLGAAKKAGDAPVSGVLAYGERPAVRGLHIMDTPGHDIESVVALAAGGCQLVAFTTGRGSPTGSPLLPVLKICTNSRTFRRLSDDIDLDAGVVLTGSETIASMGDRIYEALLRTAQGEPTSAERRGNREFALRRVARRSAPRSLVRVGA